MARQGDRGAGSRRAGSFFHRELRTTSRTCTRNVCDDGIDAADHTLQLAGAASRALEFDLFLRIPHEKFTKATALPAHELVKWQPLLLLDASRKRPMNHYSWNGRTWKAGEGRRAGQRHVPRKLCVPSGFAWAPAFRPDRPASRASRTGRPCPISLMKNAHLLRSTRPSSLRRTFCVRLALQDFVRLASGHFCSACAVSCFSSSPWAAGAERPCSAPFGPRRDSGRASTSRPAQRPPEHRYRGL